MEILITNDDGWGALGILTLTRLMTQFGHVTVLAPDGPRSGNSNAITVNQKITLTPLALSQEGEEQEWMKHVSVYTTSGTPSDCVKLAIDVLFKGDAGRIDFMVSGINHGSNAGINVIYSGTMGACFVACEHGIPAIGFSIDDHRPDADFSYMEPYVVELTKHILDEYIPYGVCYNINAPAGPLHGIRWTRQCKGHWQKEMDERMDENGEKYYWLTGEYVNHEPDAEDTDIWAMSHGMVSVQPCTIDMTSYKQL